MALLGSLGAALPGCSYVGGASLLSPLPLSSSSSSQASSAYRVLYSFGKGGRTGDGDAPLANLIAVQTLLYGTTSYGGAPAAQCSLGCGTVFRISASGRERVIYRFGGGADGAAPAAGLVFKGALVGTTSQGGGATACTNGCGTVFEVSTDGTSESLLHRFSGAPDGANPAAGLSSIGGTFYGTTQYGGTITRLCPVGCGTVFSVDQVGSEHVIYSFKGGTDGEFPIGTLAVLHGELYGTTQYGGARTNFCETGCGTVFALSSGGAKKTIYSFKYSSASADGAYPAAGLAVLDQKFYGTTFGGGKYSVGTVFALDPSSGSEKALHSFDCCNSASDGRYPVAALVQLGGVLYGTTRSGGTADAGTIFEVHISGMETVLHSFTGKPDGAAPQGRLAIFDNALFGTTAAGGTRGQGLVFELTP